MSVNFPTLKQILERSRNDMRSVLPDLDPSLVQSFIRAIVDSNAGRAYDISVLQKQLLDQAFPQTATGIFLGRWLGYNNLQQQAAQPSAGGVIIQGTAGSTIPSLTTYKSKAGDEYETQTNVTLSTISQALDSANASASKVVTCTTATDHSLATGVSVDITGLTDGADTTGASVTVIDDTTFSFTAPNVTTTGDVLGAGAQYEFDGAPVEIESVGTGLDKNLGSGSVLSIVSPIAGVNTEAYVTFGALLGGTDVETPEDSRARLLERRANPVANFNAAAIRQKVKEIASVSRVFVLEVTPFAGAVTVYFFVSDSASGIPNSSQINNVKNKILEIKPVTTDSDDVIVGAPNTVPISHTINALTPDTETLKDAVEANLEAFYEDQVDIGQDITTDQLRLVIQNSQDPTNGDFPTSFTLTSPASTTSVAADEIATFDGVTFT